MGPHPHLLPNAELFRQLLRERINLNRALVKLADLMDWARVNEVWSQGFTSARGRPATSPRLMTGLLDLQHAFDLSDEDVVSGWVENPYWRVFTGETCLETEPPIDPSSLMLMNTTVILNAVAHPIDSRLLERSREHLVKAAAECALKLHQNYNREAPRLAIQVGRYAHAPQFKRMNEALRTLRSRVGRVWRDMDRRKDTVIGLARAKLDDLLARIKRILEQQTKDKNKLYVLHAPEVQYISKGKVRTPYEFGIKVSITTALKEG